MLEHFGVTEANWREATVPHFCIAESPLYTGRAVAALAADPDGALERPVAVRRRARAGLRLHRHRRHAAGRLALHRRAPRGRQAARRHGLPLTQLLEREAELGILDAAIEAGDGRVVVITGEPGIGKTALVSAVARHRHALWGACDPLITPRPLGPFRDMASSPTRRAPRGLARARRWTRRSASAALMVIEDLHWADDATLDVLALLGRGRRAAASCSPRGPRRGSRCAACSARCRARCGSIPRRSRARRSRRWAATSDLHALTGGNPFFVLNARGGSIREAVMLRVATLGDDARAAVELAAVVPGAAEPWLLDAAARRARRVPRRRAARAPRRADRRSATTSRAARWRSRCHRSAAACSTARCWPRWRPRASTTRRGSRTTRGARATSTRSAASAPRRPAPRAPRAATARRSSTGRRWSPRAAARRRSPASRSRATCPTTTSARSRRVARCSSCTPTTRCAAARTCAGSAACSGGRGAGPRRRRPATRRSRCWRRSRTAGSS